jgi:hypothetical protein
MSGRCRRDEARKIFEEAGRDFRRRGIDQLRAAFAPPICRCGCRWLPAVKDPDQNQRLIATASTTKIAITKCFRRALISGNIKN